MGKQRPTKDLIPLGFSTCNCNLPRQRHAQQNVCTQPFHGRRGEVSPSVPVKAQALHKQHASIPALLFRRCCSSRKPSATIESQLTMPPMCSLFGFVTSVLVSQKDVGTLGTFPRGAIRLLSLLCLWMWPCQVSGHGCPAHTESPAPTISCWLLRKLRYRLSKIRNARSAHSTLRSCCPSKPWI